MAANPTWIITTDGSRPVSQIARELTKSGLANTKVLGEIKCITGNASSRDAAKMRKVRGVADVSASQNIQVDPPA